MGCIKLKPVELIGIIVKFIIEFVQLFEFICELVKLIDQLKLKLVEFITKFKLQLQFIQFLDKLQLQLKLKLKQLEFFNEFK